MSEDEPTPGPDESGEDPRPRSGAAAAAARARRIGGRVSGARPTPEEPGAEPAESPPKVSVAKTDSAAELPAPPTDTAPLPGWVNWVPAMVLGAGAVVMAVLLIVFSHGVWWGPTPPGNPSSKQVNTVRDQVLAAAKSCVATTNTYKYTDLAGYEKAALPCTTGKLATQLKKTIDTYIKPNAPKLKASQTCQINTGGIEQISADGKQWTLLLFGQLAVQNTNHPSGETDPFAAEVRMEQVHGKWLMSDLSNVSTPLSG